MIELKRPLKAGDTNIIIWSRLPSTTRLSFYPVIYNRDGFLDGTRIPIKVTNVSHEALSARQFQLTDEDVERMILPRII